MKILIFKCTHLICSLWASRGGSRSPKEPWRGWRLKFNYKIESETKTSAIELELPTVQGIAKFMRQWTWYIARQTDEAKEFSSDDHSQGEGCGNSLCNQLKTSPFGDLWGRLMSRSGCLSTEMTMIIIWLQNIMK